MVEHDSKSENAISGVPESPEHVQEPSQRGPLWQGRFLADFERIWGVHVESYRHLFGKNVCV